MTKAGHDLLTLKLCNGQGVHAEIVYDGDECARGCPLCLAMDALDLVERENNQLRCQLDAELSGRQEPLRD